MTSCYHLWPVDPIGGFLLMIMAPGLFFIMMGILILIRIIVGLRMSKLGYCNHKNSAVSLWLMVFLGVVYYCSSFRILGESAPSCLSF